MTDRYYSITVGLDRDIREDDAQCIIEAIKMIKGVLDVRGNDVDPIMWIAQERCKKELQQKIIDILYQ